MGKLTADQKMIRSFDPDFGSYSLEEITPEIVERHISKKLKEGLKPATVNRYLQCLRVILNYFIKKRHLMVNAVSIVGLLPETEAH